MTAEQVGSQSLIEISDVDMEHIESNGLDYQIK